ncbi:MAG: response regulator transcription factor [Cellvibrionales bacterium]|jgi:two-component system response regulator RegA|nr:response regulator transcription factor [Cellvibrionales bacterium]
MSDALDILLVEDDEVFASVLQRSLLRRGHRVQWERDVAAARAGVAVHAFSHAILDLKLAQESSLPLIPVLLEANPAMQILVLTGYASIQTAVQAVKLGAINYLCKPADTDGILQALLHPTPNEDAPVAENPLSVDRLEWEHIQRVLAEHEQNISATARALGMHRRTLQRKLAKRPVAR